MANQVSGVLVVYFGNAILLTVAVSTILILWYRNTVARGIRKKSNPALEGAPGDLFAPPSSVLRAADDIRYPDPRTATSAASWVRMRVAAVYGLAGLTCAAVLTVLFLFQLGDDFNALRTFVVWYTFAGQ
jgi:hypothetical protein